MQYFTLLFFCCIISGKDGCNLMEDSMSIDLVDNIKNDIEIMLKKPHDKLVAILGIIDDEGLDEIYSFIPQDIRILICVDKKFTTYQLLNKLLKFKDVYYVDNNNTSRLEQTNLLISVNGDDVEVMFITPNFLKYSLENNISTSFILKGKLKEFECLLNKYKLDNSELYSKLTQECIKEWEDKNNLRNEKATTLSKEMDLDEIKMSFRRINEIENKDEFINKLKFQKQINANKDDIIIENIVSPVNSNNIFKGNDQDIEIDIDIGE